MECGRAENALRCLPAGMQGCGYQIGWAAQHPGCKRVRGESWLTFDFRRTISHRMLIQGLYRAVRGESMITLAATSRQAMATSVILHNGRILKYQVSCSSQKAAQRQSPAYYSVHQACQKQIEPKSTRLNREMAMLPYICMYACVCVCVSRTGIYHAFDTTTT